MEKFKDGVGLILGLYAGARLVVFIDDLIKKVNGTNCESIEEVKATNAEEA